MGLGPDALGAFWRRRERLLFLPRVWAGRPRGGASDVGGGPAGLGLDSSRGAAPGGFLFFEDRWLPWGDGTGVPRPLPPLGGGGGKARGVDT